MREINSEIAPESYISIECRCGALIGLYGNGDPDEVRRAKRHASLWVMEHIDGATCGSLVVDWRGVHAALSGEDQLLSLALQLDSGVPNRKEDRPKVFNGNLQIFLYPHADGRGWVKLVDATGHEYFYGKPENIDGHIERMIGKGKYVLLMPTVEVINPT